MRYSSALALGTLAVGQAVAAGNRHASFHARRNVKSGLENVDAIELARDLKDVDWSTINWSSVFATPAPTPTPTPEVQVKVNSAAASSSSTPVPTPSSQQAAKPSETAKSNPVNDVVEGLFDGLSSVLSSLDIKPPQNSFESNNRLWLGTAGNAPLRVKHINKSGQDMKLFCWVSTKDFTGFTINKNPAAVGINLPKNGTEVVTSHGNQVPFACAPVVKGIGMPFGGIKNTWFEGQQHITNDGKVYGTFDVSKNPNMNGTPISSQGSLCKSTMETCVFQCKSSKDMCTTDYELLDCGEHNGGHQGFDTIMNGVGGGCKMNADETITVNYG